MRFDVYAVTRGVAPYVVDVQSDFMSQLDSRMVIPVMPVGRLKGRVPDLHPQVDVAGKRHVLVTHQMTSVFQKDLGGSVMSLASHRDEITRALDLLFTGF